MILDSRKIMDTLNGYLEITESCYAVIAKKNGLTYNAFLMMLMTAYYENLTQNRVCRTLLLPKSSVHSILSNLISRGYLTLTPGGNKKEKYIVPTRSGAELMEKLAAETDKMESGALEKLSESEITAFMKTAKRLTELMKAQAENLYEGE